MEKEVFPGRVGERGLYTTPMGQEAVMKDAHHIE
jgi:hypothetical protein